MTDSYDDYVNTLPNSFDPVSLTGFLKHLTTNRAEAAPLALTGLEIIASLLEDIHRLGLTDLEKATSLATVRTLVTPERVDRVQFEADVIRPLVTAPRNRDAAAGSEAVR
jgi:hypothetical protein